MSDTEERETSQEGDNRDENWPGLRISCDQPAVAFSTPALQPSLPASELLRILFLTGRPGIVAVVTHSFSSVCPCIRPGSAVEACSCEKHPIIHDCLAHTVPADILTSPTTLIVPSAWVVLGTGLGRCVALGVTHRVARAVARANFSVCLLNCFIRTDCNDAMKEPHPKLCARSPKTDRLWKRY
jgi:hypothetical protein